MSLPVPSWSLVEALPEDLPDLQMLEAACFEPERRSKKRTLRHALRSQAQKVWLVRTSEGQAVAAMICLLYPHTLRIYSVCVLTSFRGSGIGAGLVAVAEDFARKTGRGRISLEAARREKKLVAWYRKLGYEIVKELPDYYAPGVDALRMVKRL